MVDASGPNVVRTSEAVTAVEDASLVETTVADNDPDGSVAGTEAKEADADTDVARSVVGTASVSEAVCELSTPEAVSDAVKTSEVSVTSAVWISDETAPEMSLVVPVAVAEGPRVGSWITVDSAEMVEDSASDVASVAVAESVRNEVSAELVNEGAAEVRSEGVAVDSGQSQSVDHDENGGHSVILPVLVASEAVEKAVLEAVSVQETTESVETRSVDAAELSVRGSDKDGAGGRSLETSPLVVKVSVVVANTVSDGEVAVT